MNDQASDQSTGNDNKTRLDLLAEIAEKESKKLDNSVAHQESVDKFRKPGNTLKRKSNQSSPIVQNFVTNATIQLSTTFIFNVPTFLAPSSFLLFLIKNVL